MKENKFDYLVEVLTDIDDKKVCESFLEDLCTIQELEQMNQRLLAAKMLLEGNTYEEVTRKTKVSSATLSRISKCIRYGDGGYKKAIYKGAVQKPN